MMPAHLPAFLVLTLLLPAAVAAADNAPPLGRLFLTPEWRATLERQRKLNLQETRGLEGGSMRLDGVVVRSSGKSTVWVNNQPQTENAGETGVVATVARQRPSRATLTTGTEAPVDLTVGVTVNRSTRETSGGLTEGEIRVRRPAAQK
jgi:hypothetical protein